MAVIEQFPDKMTLLARDIKSDIDKLAANDTEWVETNISLATKLAAARKELKADQDFGKWCEDNGFGEKALDAKTRGHLITMIEKPDIMREVLSGTDNRSIRYIYDTNKNRFESTAKRRSGRSAKPAGGSQPKGRRIRGSEPIEKAREAVRPNVVGDIPIDRAKVAEDLGVGERDVRDADLMERGRLEGLQEAAIDEIRDVLPKTSKAKLEAVIRQEAKRLEEEYRIKLEKRMSEHNAYIIETMLPNWKEKERIAEAARKNFETLINNKQPIYTISEFRTIINCLHPDRLNNPPNEDQLNTAFNLFQTKKFQLTHQK